MTTAARARKLHNKFREKNNPYIPKKQNSEKNVRHFQGLPVQPFFDAIIACRQDLQAVVDSINPYDRHILRETIKPIHALNAALDDAGYSHMGQPDWVSIHDPDLGKLDQVAKAAKECVPIIMKQYAVLVKNAAQGTEFDQKSFAAFITRLAAYHQAYQGLHDWVTTERYLREVSESRKMAVEECALS
jgi:hypothetical protein